LNIVSRKAGLLAHSIFVAFPPLPIAIGIGAVARSAKIIQSLQLRVQLRNLTGFPLDTRKEHHHFGGKGKAKINSGANYFMNNSQEVELIN
jgi:hypothetical protein